MKKTKKSWIDNNTFLKIIAVLIAIIAWVSIVMTENTSVSSTIKNIPLNLKLQEIALSQIGLNIVEIDTTTVSCDVTGDYSTIWKLEPEQLAATVQLSETYTEPGEYELSVVPAVTSVTGSLPYKITGYTPSTIRVKLDKIESRPFKVYANITGQSVVPTGYIRGNTETLTPEEIIVSGPIAELDKIKRCVVDLELNGTLDKTFVAPELPVKLLNVQDEEIDFESHHLVLDNNSVQLVISILKEKELPLSVEFLNIPRGFPLDDLTYRMSNHEVTVAGPVDASEKYKELLLGFVDLSDISIQNNVFNFDVEIPSGFTNTNNIKTIAVTFDNTNWAEEVFNLDTTRILNVPSGYEVATVTNQIYNVTMVGDAGVISELTVDDIVVELDLADKMDLSIGQYESTVKISVPTKGLVWAHGEYSVVIHVTKLN